MALEDCCQTFVKYNPDVQDVFYATTPPKVISDSVLNGGFVLGNLHIAIQPHVFISPENILDMLVKSQKLSSHRAFARSKGFALLLPKGNPKNIIDIADLLHDDVCLTISNPTTEKASYDVYKNILLTTADEQKLEIDAFANLIEKNSSRTVFGQSIHHREVPQTIFEGRADVAIVYYHLALRYTRIFPDDFELIEIKSNANIYTDYHIGLMNNAGEWGQLFLDFMMSEQALNIYAKHGLTACE